MFRRARLSKQTLIGLERQIECRRIIFGAGETRRVVGEGGARQLIPGVLCYLVPALGAPGSSSASALNAKPS